MEISPLTLATLLLFSFLYGICIGIVNDINRIVRVFFGARYTNINFDKLYAFLKIQKSEENNEEIPSKRKRIKNISLNILIFIQDIFLMLFVATGVILLNYYFNDGRFRLFTILAMALSSVLYYFTIGKLVMLISEPIMLIIRTSIIFIINTLLLPIRALLNLLYSLSKKTLSKIRKRIAKLRDIRYNKREQQRLFDLSKHGFINTSDNKGYKNYEN